MRFILTVFLGVLPFLVYCQVDTSTNAQKWADSVYNSLSNDERIGQIIITRLSSMDVKTKKITFLYNQVSDYISTYNIGGVCVFQGSPYIQAQYLNSLKAKAKTPLLISIDGEWGVGMRIIDSVIPLPKQMMLGAIHNPLIIYEYGKIVANQCKRLGIQMNYAPVMDVNNNPNNPVINDRSFGENKYKVAEFGSQYMKGMQDNGVLACAKHFPGHGFAQNDTHKGLTDTTDLANIDLELKPYSDLLPNSTNTAVMTAHIINRNLDENGYPATLSKKIITGILREALNFQGVVVTDALEMGAIRNYYSLEDVVYRSIDAGNDILVFTRNSASFINSEDNDSWEITPQKIINIIEHGVLNGTISQGRVEESYSRIMQLKKLLEFNNAEIN